MPPSQGKAVEWLLREMTNVLEVPAREGNSTLLPIYIGDDTSDEDAFTFVSQAWQCHHDCRRNRVVI